jgi:hypothetical protein
MAAVEVLPPEGEVPKTMNGTQQLLTLGTQLAEAILGKLRESGDDSRDADDAAATEEDGEKERLRRICARARRLNAQVSSALGACRCWGRRRDCPECGGEGRPGFHPIDPGAFSAFVAPAVVAEPETFLELLRMNAGAAENQT